MIKTDNIIPHSKLIHGLLLTGGLILIAGCRTPDAARQVKGFSEATILTANNLTQAFTLAEDYRFREEVSVSVLNFEPKPGSDGTPGFSPNRIEPFMNTNALQLRLDVLEGLKAYAADLSALMGNGLPISLDRETTKLGQALNNINTNLVADSFFKTAPATSQEIQIFTTALNTLGHWLMAHKQQREAKLAIASMQQPVADICQLLQKDLGILRQQMLNDCHQTLMNENQYILNNLSQFNNNPAQKRAAILEMATLTREMRNDATLFDATKSSVAKLAAANNALGQVFSKNTSDINSLINDLSAESRRISAYYNSLRTTQ